MTLFQINGAENDPVTRGLAFLSLVFALWSLVYACLYIIQFRRLRSTNVMVKLGLVSVIYYASLHVLLTHVSQQEIQRRNSGTFWNPWIMFALPAISLAWCVFPIVCETLAEVDRTRFPRSVLVFIAAIVWFMWRACAHPPRDFSPYAPQLTELGFRVATCVILGISVVHLFLAVVGFLRLGAPIADEWGNPLDQYAKRASFQSNDTQFSPVVAPRPLPVPQVAPRPLPVRPVAPRPLPVPPIVSSKEHGAASSVSQTRWPMLPEIQTG